MSDWNIFGTAPESLAGLLGAQATQDLQKKAMTTGLINTALGYLVQPKNQNLGLGRILGQSLMSGMQGAQGVYTGALEDWQTKQKIAELQRKQTQQVAQEQAISQLPAEQQSLYRAYGEAAIPKLVERALPTQKERETMIAPNGQLIYKDTGELVTQASFAAPKELKAPPTRTRQVGRTQIQEQMNADGTWAEIGRGSMDAPVRETEPSYSMQTDKNGRAVYVPNKPGMPAIDATTNKPIAYEPKFEEKPLTADQGKAANFYNRMTPISKKLNAPMIDTNTKKPLLNEDGSPMTMEDYVGNPSITAQALRAIPSFGLTSKIAGASIGNYRQQMETLKKNWLTANLRKESGAVIGAEEMQTEDEKYFPQIGDSFETRKLKKELRRQAEEGMLLESGKGGKTMPNSNNVLNKADAIIAGVK